MFFSFTLNGLVSTLPMATESKLSRRGLPQLCGKQPKSQGFATPKGGDILRDKTSIPEKAVLPGLIIK